MQSATGMGEGVQTDVQPPLTGGAQVSDELLDCPSIIGRKDVPTADSIGAI
ncbi:hypothetical protein D3C72_2486960 [compost metagenome]